MDTTKTNNQKVVSNEVALVTLNDFKSSLIIVSVLVNLLVLTTWMAAQLSSGYAAQLISLI